MSAGAPSSVSPAALLRFRVLQPRRQDISGDFAALLARETTMPTDARTSRVMILIIVVLAQGTRALAQASTSEPMSAWAVGASAGLWGRLAGDPSQKKTANVALDARVE